MSKAKKSRKKRVYQPKIEINCRHYSDTTFRFSGFGFSFYLCSNCLGRMSFLISKALQDMTEAKIDVDYTTMGFYCHKCNKRQLGDAHVHQRIISEKKARTSYGERIEYYVPTSKRVTHVYCSSCWKEMNEARGMILTRRNIFLPAELDDGFVKGFFGDRIKKTEKIFTVVPVEFIKKVMEKLPQSDRVALNEDFKALTDETTDKIVEKDANVK